MNIERRRNKMMWASVWTGFFVWILAFILLSSISEGKNGSESVMTHFFILLLKGACPAGVAIAATLRILEAVTGIEFFPAKEEGTVSQPEKG